MAGYGECMKGTNRKKHGETDEEGEVVQGIGEVNFFGVGGAFFIYCCGCC